MTNIRIGYEHPDTLITYPDAWFLSGCTVPIQNEGRWIDTTHSWVTHATASVLSTAPARTTYPHTRARSRSAAMSPPHTTVRHCRNTHPTTYTAPHTTVRHCRNTHPTTHTTPHTVFWRCRDAHPTTRTPPHGARPIRHAHLARHARLAQPHPAPASGANKTHTQRAYKTRPDQPVRARNVFGSGVRTLAVVRAVLTTIATLTTPLRHVILLGFVV